MESSHVSLEKGTAGGRYARVLSGALAAEGGLDMLLLEWVVASDGSSAGSSSGTWGGSLATRPTSCNSDQPPLRRLRWPGEVVPAVVCRVGRGASRTGC